MRLKLFSTVAAVLCVSMLYSQSVNAYGVDPTHIKSTGPLWAIDLGRAITNMIKGILEMTGDGGYKAQLIAVQEGTNANADGTPGDEPTNNTAKANAASVAASQLKNDAYSYIKAEILDQTDLSKYSVFQKNLADPKNEGHSEETCSSLNWTTDQAKKTCMAVVNTFFADLGEDNNELYKGLILAQRNVYVNQIAKRHLELGYTAQQKVITDLQAAAVAPVSSGNEVGAIAIDGQTLDEMLKITVADLALQVEMMEADAMAFLMQQPIEIMTKDKPMTTEE